MTSQPFPPWIHSCCFAWVTCSHRLRIFWFRYRELVTSILSRTNQRASDCVLFGAEVEDTWRLNKILTTICYKWFWKGGWYSLKGIQGVLSVLVLGELDPSSPPPPPPPTFQCTSLMYIKQCGQWTGLINLLLLSLKTVGHSQILTIKNYLFRRLWSFFINVSLFFHFCRPEREAVHILLLLLWSPATARWSQGS